MMISKGCRSLRRKEYRLAIDQLRQRHPWLAQQIVEPPPGHLRVLAHFLAQCELLMGETGHQNPLMLCVTTVRDKMLLRCELTNASMQRERAIQDITEQARDAAQLSCPVCGAPSMVSDVHAAQGQRCMEHAGVGGLFAEDVRRHRQMARQRGAQRTSLTVGHRGDEVMVLLPKTESGEDEQQAAVSLLLSSASPSDAAEPCPTEPTVTLLELAGLKRFVDRHRPKGDDKLRRAQAMVERINTAGSERRKLGVLPCDWPAVLDEFIQAFPNFFELADLLRDHFALSALGDQRVAWPPVLLVGSAGIGKTEAARWLAEKLSLPFRVLDMASAQSGSPLAGSESFWSNSEPGMLFELLAYQPKANPIMLLDELDKVDQQKPYDPMAPLYTLLESRSARSFMDLSIRDFTIDASHVNWIATANCADNIPAPLLSRMAVLHVQAPTPDQVARIAQAIYVRMRAEACWGETFASKLDDAVLDQLRGLPPRQLSQALRRALGRAARDERDHITIQDLPPAMGPAVRGIGFIAT
ncbi:MAG: AAA family ATPase [Aquabacterium sp.]|nr:AAA family ATPase [Aquabacterium sp.]